MKRSDVDFCSMDCYLSYQLELQTICEELSKTIEEYQTQFPEIQHEYPRVFELLTHAKILLLKK